MNWEAALNNNIQVRRIDNKIDEIVLRKDGDVLMHLEKMDKGVIHLVVWSGDEERHFSLNSRNEIEIIDQG